jgi:glyoxylase-like metal-dependent hydrolase (beta-lactamase superfamily II)
MDIYTGKGYGIARIRIEDSDSNYNYIVWCTETNQCAVIDPIDPITILNFIRDKGLMVKYVHKRQ